MRVSIRVRYEVISEGLFIVFLGAPSDPTLVLWGEQLMVPTPGSDSEGG